jgi:hypothetical protein
MLLSVAKIEKERQLADERSKKIRAELEKKS